MEFTFETRYNAQTLTVLAKALRKTVRKRHSRRTRIFAWTAAVLDVLLLAAKGFTPTPRTAFLAVAGLVLLSALLLEDRINGRAACKRLLPGTETARAAFSDGGFTSVTDAGRTEWHYGSIAAVAETADFFVLVFDAHHAQLCDKRTLQGGTPEDFRRFIETAAGLPVPFLR